LTYLFCHHNMENCIQKTKQSNKQYNLDRINNNLFIKNHFMQTILIIDECLIDYLLFSDAFKNGYPWVLVRWVQNNKRYD
jgi:hypothetical protein